MKSLGKYSIGLGDRFGHQGEAQLMAVIEAAKWGTEITPVWNKSNREHNTIGSLPADVRTEADTAVQNSGFQKPYFVDADHINIDTVDRFIEHSDFFTIDVASYIGKTAGEDEIAEFLSGAARYAGKMKIKGMETLNISVPQIREIGLKYLFAVIRAREIYRKIEKVKGKGNFITEISMDEVSSPQSPPELFFILYMLASEDIPVQTIAPKFSGRFNKGVDYAGDPQIFAREFESDLTVIDLAVKEFGLQENLKMSIHSGSDKFSIYPYIGSIIKKYSKGIHLKTAGTTWLEEVIGLAESGGKALDFVKELFIESLDRIDELCAPYSDVIDIKTALLPSKDHVPAWDSNKFSQALKHIPDNPFYNPNMRQLLHVAYKLAAERLDEYLFLLDANRNHISRCVYENIYSRHICRLFSIQ